MNSSLVTRITATVLAVLALVVFSSLIAISAAWRGRSVMLELQQSLMTTRAAEELEIALLDQRGVVAAYLLDNGNRDRLKDLPGPEAAFENWLRKSRELADVSHQRDLLDELEVVYHRYIEKRKQVIEIYDSGQPLDAKKLLLEDVNRLYGEAYALCEQIISNNESLADIAIANVDRATRLELWLVISAVIISSLLTAWLLRMLFHGILRPLRTMIEEARNFEVESSGLVLRSREDELREIGYYLRRLMTNVKDSRETLSEHRERLKNSENLASVGKLASCVAHEIRNPLTAINIWLYSAERGLPNPSPQRDMISKALQETHRLEQVVAHFLEFSRPPELKCSPVALGEIVRRSVELAQPAIVEKDIHLDDSQVDRHVEIVVDPNQLTQVVSNLLINAVDASLPGHKIRIVTQYQARSEASGPALRWLVLRVVDEGRGISEANRERVFEPFFTTKEGGTGLGLCIAANIMVRHNGRLHLEESGTTGTTFSVWLPLNDDGTNKK